MPASGRDAQQHAVMALSMIPKSGYRLSEKIMLKKTKAKW
jgi:hypothetical protein